MRLIALGRPANHLKPRADVVSAGNAAKARPPRAEECAASKKAGLHEVLTDPRAVLDTDVVIDRAVRRMDARTRRLVPAG